MNNYQRQQTQKILVVDTIATLPIEFSMLLPYYVDRVIGYECFFEAQTKLGADVPELEQLELSISKDNFKSHAIHDIIVKNEYAMEYEKITFEVDGRKRLTGFIHNPIPLPQHENVSVKLFLIVE